MLSAMRRIRLERGLTQWEVAKALDVSRGMVSYWEHGHYTPSQEQLERLAALYGVAVGALLADNN